MPPRRLARLAVGVLPAVVAATLLAGPGAIASAAGTNLFVSPTGLDTNSGTSASTPFKTLQHALDLAQPGTTINLAAGTYKEAASTKVAGTAGAPITIEGPSSGRNDATLLSPAGRALSINHSYYTVDGFTIDGQPNIARSEYPTSLSAVRAFKDSVQTRAVNSKLIYVAAADTAVDLTGITISNMFLNGSGGECVRLRNRTSNVLVVGSTVQWCGMYGQGNDTSEYRYHNGEGIYVGTSPKSTTQPYAANDTSNNVVVRDSTVHTFGAECLEVKENAHHNRLENVDCGFNDEPLSFKGSNIELRGDHNLILNARVSQSRSWNVKMASDAPTYDRGGNSIQKSRFSDAAAPALRADQSTVDSSFCGNTFASTPASEGSSNLGDPTAPCADTTAPTAPTNLAATATSPTTVGLTWAAATDDVGVTAYDVLRDGTRVGGTTGDLAFSDSGLTAGTAYSYTVVARDAANNASPPSAAASVTTPVPPPPPPTAVKASATSPTGVAVTWTAPANAAVASYGVLRNGTQVGTSTTTSYADSGLTPATAYSYTVVARDAAGASSAPSDAVSVTTPAAPPPAPTAVKASATSPTAVAVTWTAPANAAVASYGVLRNGTQVGTSTTTSYADSGLTPSTAYSYTVVARDAAGNASPPSTAASVTTPAAPTAQVIVAEAESGTLTAPMAAYTDSKAQGSRYVSQTSGTSVGKDTITVNVAVAGRYALALRVISPNASSDSFTCGVDNGAATALNLGTHTSWTWVTGPTVTLTAGQHRIVVSKRENGARLDAVRLTPA